MVLHQRVNLLKDPGEVMVGVPYASALLAILGVRLSPVAFAGWIGVFITALT
jgi:hypothetical protein